MNIPHTKYNVTGTLIADLIVVLQSKGVVPGAARRDLTCLWLTVLKYVNYS